MKFSEKFTYEGYKKITKKFLVNFTHENVELIILQQFKKISWNILKILKQHSKKFRVNFVPIPKM